MKKGTLPLSRDAREVDPATLAALLGGASDRAVQPAEADFKAIVRTWRPELVD
ncbi:hypothetical protein [Nitrosospira sp. NRS527]|uniref:hypothetical protein n=1 Tax=Nitrosospira sp. NRS527 TaxID=155925 RepID=UPI001AF132EA|nr:hypothetical protein [Nitrosospira sp. NRS527]BCT69538.1 hypothetical protein NNRS527_03163 [Nitrosospira sp. NRS527]